MTNKPERRRGPYPGEMARQGQIVLNSKLRRNVFIGGLIAVVVFAIIVAVIAY